MAWDVLGKTSSSCRPSRISTTLVQSMVTSSSGCQRLGLAALVLAALRAHVARAGRGYMYISISSRSESFIDIGVPGISASYMYMSA